MANILQTSLEDDYEHPDDNLNYVLENVLLTDYAEDDKQAYEDLYERFHSYLLNSCNCAGNDDCRQCHQENYVFNGAELVLHKTEFIYECSDNCGCSKTTCLNRLVQYGPRKHLQIIDSQRFKSKGVITRKFIPKGGFICEYVGELLTLNAAIRRLKENTQKHKNNYILCLKESPLNTSDLGDTILTIVDPSVQGNIGRYINHSCDPNCQIISVRVDCIIPKIAIFAMRNIAAQEELSFNYAGSLSHSTKLSKTPCLCGSEKCLQFLPAMNI